MSWLRAHREPLGGLLLLVVGLVLAMATRVYLLQVLGTAAALSGAALGWSWAWPRLDRRANFPIWRRAGEGAPAPSLDPAPRARPGIGWSDQGAEAPGPRGARRANTAEYSTDEERSGPGWIGALSEQVISGRALTWQRVAWEAAGPVVLVTLLVVLYHPLLAGHFPWQADHTVHQQKAWLLSERLLSSGRIFGWTHQSGTGYPAETLYPPLGDLWIAVVRYGTFKQLSFSSTYAVGFFGVIAFGVLSFYYMGRRLFGPLAGFLAAFFVLTDMGGFREGGYVFTIQYGVWPLHLGITLGFLALLKFHDLLSGEGWRHLGRFSLLLGAALLAHPVTLIFFLVALPLQGLLFVLRQSPGAPPILGRALSGIALGVGLAAFWLLPFVAKASGHSAHVANHWKAIGDIAGGILGADLWQGAWAWPTVMGGIGALLALRERRHLACFLVALAAALLAAASLTIYTELDLGSLLSSARFVQFQRFVIFVKLIAFLLAGFVAQRIFLGLTVGALDACPRDAESARAAPAAPAGWRRHARLGVVTLLLAPFVLPLCWRLVEDRLLPVSNLAYERDKGGFVSDFRAALDHVCKEARRPGAPFFRVAYLSGFNDHEMANASVYCPVPEVKLSFIPSETFKPRAHLQPSLVPRTAEDFRYLNVRYVVGNSTQAVPAFLMPILRRGRVTLHEVPNYQPEQFTLLCPEPGEAPATGAGPAKAPGGGPAKAPGGGPAKAPGGGPAEAPDSASQAPLRPVPPGELGVKITAFADEEIRIQAGEVPPGCSLVVHVAHFANWRARRGGRDLPIRAHDLTPRVRGLMLIPLEKGVTVISYRRLPVDWLAWGFTLLTLLIFGFRFWLRFRPGVREALVAVATPWVKLLRRPVRLAVLALALLSATLVLSRAAGCGERPTGPRSLTSELGSARVYIAAGGGRSARCATYQMGRWICGKGRRWVGPVAEEWNLKNRLGIWAHPDEAGPLVIEFPGQRLGSRLEIDYGILQSGGVGAPVTMAVLIDGEPAGEVSWPRTRGPAGWAPAPLVIDTSSRRGKRATLRFSVFAPHIGGRHFAFDPRIVP